MSDLVERLRAVEPSRDFSAGSDDCGVTNYYRNPDGPEAAAELERLYARVEELEGALRDIARKGRTQGYGKGALSSIACVALRPALTNSGAPDDEGNYIFEA